MARNQDSTTTRTEDAWWSWHDEDYSRHYATTEEAEEACRAWVAGESDVGPALDSTTTRLWALYEEGHHYDTIEADDAQDAIEVARDNVDAANYGDITSTIWIDVAVYEIDQDGERTGDRETATVTIDPEEPDCEGGGSHDWSDDYDLVGGIRENPGVWGHGGGVIMHHVCTRCAAKRITDTWAQRPDTGDQGLESVRYETADERDDGYEDDRAETERAVEIVRRARMRSGLSEEEARRIVAEERAAMEEET